MNLKKGKVIKLEAKLSGGMKSGTFERNLKTFVFTSPTVLLNTYPQINWHVPQQSNRHRALGMSKNLERSSNMVRVICPLCFK